MQGWARGSKSKSELNELAANGLVFYSGIGLRCNTSVLVDVTKHVGCSIESRRLGTFVLRQNPW
jgi:hypothetical protein